MGQGGVKWQRNQTPFFEFTLVLYLDPIYPEPDPNDRKLSNGEKQKQPPLVGGTF